MTRRVLVTGARGFIGRHCLASLAGKGYEVHAVTSRGADPRAPVDHWHQADLLAPGQATAVVEAVRPTHLLHLAWVTTPGAYWQSPENLDWVRASLELARAFQRAGGQRLVAAGSCAEYAWRFARYDEATPAEPSTLYGTCKLALQRMLDAHAAATGLSTAWGRVFHLYGPHEARGRLVPAVAEALLRGEPAALTHGEQRRDFLHVQDAADAFVALLDSEVAGVVNIGSGEPVRLREIALAIAAELGHPDLLQFGARPAPPGEPPELVSDPTRLFHDVGFRPQIPLSEGLAATARWWREGKGL